MIVLNKGSVQLEGSIIMLIAEMITAINGVQTIVEEDFGTEAANQIIDKAVEMAKQNNSKIDILELATELAEVRKNGSKNQIKKNGTEEGSFLQNYRGRFQISQRRKIHRGNRNL